MTKMLSAVHSATLPASFNISASSASAKFASSRAITMFAESKNTTIIETNPLENSVAVQETMVENGDFRVGFGVKFPVNVNLCFFDAHGSGPWTTFNCRFNY